MTIPIVPAAPEAPAVDPVDIEPDLIDPGEDPDAAVEGEEALADPGKRALDATREKWRAERDRRVELEEELRLARRQMRSGQPAAPAVEPSIDADSIREDAERSALAKANARIVRAEVKGAAAALFADPADALAFLDLTSFDVDDKGDVDVEDIQAALTELLAKKPHLAKQDSAPQGGSKRRIPEVPADPAHKPSIPVSHADRIKAAQTAGDVTSFISLQNDLLTQQQ
jgi:hypothetical protein